MSQSPTNPARVMGRLKEPIYMKVQEDGLLLRCQRFETERGIYRLYFYWDQGTEAVWMLKYKGDDLVEAVNLTALGKTIAKGPSTH